ncbi:N-acetylmuramoyl-L-alanine amidase [Sporosarcina sp. BI001-red]|uniref:N-acetylmuramoyl-L-alanine amidase n=1 Tax=Sporosarcina sp. BI001-red TaxID=2282866 RepID=UPI000E21C70D|nr:N-acetylmuramoyl-L-alanine amidase [Sporosarcina sp. BI001-red]REB07206.1 N-acetylmuramoyl-L-alanine amidase [Sporosarcina sp. BI001-red]
MAKLAKLVVAILLLSVTLLDARPATANSSGQTVVVDSPTLNVRSGPGLTYSLIGKLKDGQKVQVLDRSDDWLQVSVDGETGWIASWLTKSNERGSNEGKTIVSRVDSLNIRSSPSVNSAAIGKLRSGDLAKLVEYQGEWASIIVDGMEGWVHTTYITEVDADQKQTVSESEKPQVMDANTFTVIVNKLNVRKKPDQTSKRIGTVSKNDTYPIQKIDGNWVKISLSGKKSGWVYSFHGELSSKTSKTSSNSAKTVSIVTNGTNIRVEPTTSSDVALRADAGDVFQVVKKDEEWYEIKLPSGGTAYVAEWVVNSSEASTPSTNQFPKKTKRVRGTLKGITIALDPGHGGNDRGTTGTRGTDEKNLTLQTAELLAGKLKDAGATVVMTRNSDTYVSLRKRPSIAHQEGADAFVSLHYDANPDRSITGFTTYYTQSTQQPFAQAVNEGLSSSIDLPNRGTQHANYLVLRENGLPAVLIELGFLSNSSEERILTSAYFREQASQGIYKGLLHYFDAQ